MRISSVKSFSWLAVNRITCFQMERQLLHKDRLGNIAFIIEGESSAIMNAIPLHLKAGDGDLLLIKKQTLLTRCT